VKQFSRVFLVSLLTMGISLALAAIPAWDSRAKEAVKSFDFTVFGQQKDPELTERNLVDSMMRLPLHLKINKVELSHSILSVDLVILYPRDTQIVFEEWYELAAFSFGRTSNIDQLFVRILKPEVQSGEGQLLAAMDARRQNFPVHDQIAEKMSRLSMEQYVRSHARLTFTESWTELQMHAGE